MKRNAFAILILFCLLFVTETNAQRRGYRYRYAPPRPYVRVIPRVIVPRIFVPPPVIGFSWGYRPRVYVAPPPIIIGGGRGWRHYHPRGYDRRGYDCNGDCHRWSDDRYYRNRDRRDYDDSYRRERNYYNDSDRRDNNDSRDDNRNRRYNDNDRYYNRLENNQQSSPKTYNTDEDSYEEETKTVDTI